MTLQIVKRWRGGGVENHSVLHLDNTECQVVSQCLADLLLCDSLLAWS